MAEKYIGTKFKTNFIGEFKVNSNELKIIKELIKVGKRLGRMGFEDDNGGNFSYKVKRGVIIKTTGSFPHQLKIDDFVLMTGFDKNKVDILGNKEPSSEARLHWQIYLARRDIACILHSHDKIAIKSKTLLKEVVYIKELPYGTLKSAKSAALASLKGDYLLMKNHGVIALAKSIKGAYNLIKKYHEKFKTIKKSIT